MLELDDEREAIAQCGGRGVQRSGCSWDASMKINPKMRGS